MQKKKSQNAASSIHEQAANQIGNEKLENRMIYCTFLYQECVLPCHLMSLLVAVIDNSSIRKGRRCQRVSENNRPWARTVVHSRDWRSQTSTAGFLQMGQLFFWTSHSLMQLKWKSCPHFIFPRSSSSAYSSCKMLGEGIEHTGFCQENNTKNVMYVPVNSDEQIPHLQKI